MNYQKIYDDLIAKAKSQVIADGEYKERHHIIPTCLGGEDTKENLVDVYPEQHLVLHLLLVKIHPKHYGLATAAVMMTGKKRYNRKTYAWVKLNMSEKAKARVVTQEARDKMSKARKGKPQSPEHKAARLAAMQTPEYKEKMRLAILGKKRSAETVEKNRNAQKNMSKETRDKILKAQHAGIKRKRELQNKQ